MPLHKCSQLLSLFTVNGFASPAFGWRWSRAAVLGTSSSLDYLAVPPMNRERRPVRFDSPHPTTDTNSDSMAELS